MLNCSAIGTPQHLWSHFHARFINEDPGYSYLHFFILCSKKAGLVYIIYLSKQKYQNMLYRIVHCLKHQIGKCKSLSRFCLLWWTGFNSLWAADGLYATELIHTPFLDMRTLEGICQQSIKTKTVCARCDLLGKKELKWETESNASSVFSNSSTVTTSSPRKIFSSEGKGQIRGSRWWGKCIFSHMRRQRKALTGCRQSVMCASPSLVLCQCAVTKPGWSHTFSP